MSIDSVANERHIYLTTKGRKTGNLHTVQLMFAHAGKKIYLSHEGTYTDWMKNILKDSRVEFKMGNIQFKGNARIAKDGEIFEVGKHALYHKYYGEADEDTINDWFSESTVIEITMTNKP